MNDYMMEISDPKNKDVYIFIYFQGI